MIDAHQHFWKVDRGDYGWLEPSQAVLYRDFLPADLEPLRLRAGIEQTVLVQAAPTMAETRFLLEVATSTPWVAGVVGWVGMDSPGAADDLAALNDDPALVGVRPMIQDIEDPDWMLRPAVGDALRVLEQLGLRFDALVKPMHLDNLARLLADHPDLPVVIDHGAKPHIAAGEIDGWSADVSRLARETRAVCKLSGLVTEAGDDPGVDRLRPYVDVLLREFGPDRLMWGSDWPVVELAGGYESWQRSTMELLAGLSDADRTRILDGTARSFYGLGRIPVTEAGSRSMGREVTS